ncbi:DUF3976 domain-containing protein [Gracilibacillus salinarum]|uniref:DUF3976 domain-containing protein n=1 Tax=Gracilibacillus salinarum TaxID=2932255 RepID=A0ABY4GKG7_9BACI|nr:DUF3976 domain-containing protein [Gracilibacillus salinarum]UOQ84848.1 DUF3976 domain-containing protein [Gracilibacillus salinarum]
MQSFLFIIMFIIGYIVLFLFVRNDVDEEKKLTRKGFIKLITGITVIFVSTAVIVAAT